MKPINYADLISRARRDGKGLYADFVISLEEALTEIEMQRGKIERLEAARTEEDAIALLRLWYKRLEYSDPHGDAPRVAEVLRRYPMNKDGR